MNQTNRILLTPDLLWKKVKEKTEYALSCDALKPILTEYKLIKNEEIDFLVRIVTNLNRKDNAKKQQKKLGKDFNPFLPYEKDLFVADISETHLCLLNKFNVINHHLLIITRDFQEQENLLNLNDFAALWACLLQIDGLGFYNNGKIAGASQRHKHLQLVPFPFIPEISKTPVDPIIKKVNYKNNIGQLSSFDFYHGISQLNIQDDKNILEVAKLILDTYYHLLNYLKLQVKRQEKPKPYNLLVTREWMMMIPRSQPKYESISINSLGFAGALLVKNEKQLNLLKQVKPLKILQQVAQ